MLYILIFVPTTIGFLHNYWDDSSFQCESLQEVRELERNTNQCVRINSMGDVRNNLQMCKDYLSEKLLEKCETTKVKNPGKLLYCRNIFTITCCFKQATCSTWSDINLRMYVRAKEYLTSTQGFLQNLTQLVGYKTCHSLGSSTDASKCALDCQAQEKGQFATRCANEGGVFKCCIR